MHPSGFVTPLLPWSFLPSMNFKLFLDQLLCMCKGRYGSILISTKKLKIRGSQAWEAISRLKVVEKNIKRALKSPNLVAFVVKLKLVWMNRLRRYLRSLDDGWNHTRFSFPKFEFFWRVGGQKSSPIRQSMYEKLEIPKITSVLLVS